jgi:uncharacterized membrane protein
MISCVLPTTPNPTSGFYLLVAEDEVHAIDLTVEEAFKIVMSAGLVWPAERAGQRPIAAIEPPDEADAPAAPATAGK